MARERLIRNMAPLSWASWKSLPNALSFLSRSGIFMSFRAPCINAFATGIKSDALIVVTQGMLNKLTARELTGVLAHEIAHIRNNDLWTMSLADTMSRFTYFMALLGTSSSPRSPCR